MGQPSAEWVAEQHRAEQEMAGRYARLNDRLIRVADHIARLESRADRVAALSGGDASMLRQDVEDLRALVRIAEYHLANLSRVYLIEEAPRQARSSFGGSRR
ncbi:MAG: hypothetical protein WAP03_21890 [Methylorubrum rhodinum]|uniref:hypothetical protein n=1 Tax=Methylorubrum rhodinum TaxID=29428 RepID=UPI003BB05180